ncbi:MAG: hypothetical protein R2777_05725 [Chitinophagales bacterium]
MKKLSLLFMLFGIATMTFLSSCGDSTNTGEDAPLLTVTPSESGNVVEGTVVTVEVSAGQIQLLKRFENINCCNTRYRYYYHY